MPDKQGKISIRGLDPKLYAEARAQAIIEQKTIGEWLTEVIEHKLKEVPKE